MEPSYAAAGRFLAQTRSARLLVLGAATLWLSGAVQSAPSAPPAARAPVINSEATALVQELNSQRPTRDISLLGVFRIRHPDGRREAIPVNYQVRLTQDHWESIYRTQATSTTGQEELVVAHQPAQPSRYLLTQISLDGSRTNTQTLTGREAAVSFAGSDFWLIDLGLEFLHWPGQHLVKDAKITMRLGRPCKVLESTNPDPAEPTYRRVVSWIDSELGSVIYAEAYDSQNKRFKVFSLKGFEKVNGRWQVKDMEIRNDKADSRTRLEFNFVAD